MRSIWVAIALLILSSFARVSAQGMKMDAPRVYLDKLDTSKVTCEELLKNTKLVSPDPSWVVTKFRISFTLPDGKVYGPFLAEGASLPDAAIKTIKRLKKNKADITIDEINVMHNGKEKFTYPVNLKYNN
jgi:hypothetical protein